MDDGDARAVEGDGHLAGLGFSVHASMEELAASERAMLEPSVHEDAASEHRRYRRRDGSKDACRLPCERDIPKASASGEEWTAWHASRLGKGGWDPGSLVRPRTIRNT